MSETLLDASMLIAHLWQEHEFHAVARRWMNLNAHKGWATCAVTQAAFVRILSNPSVSKNGVSLENALELLEVNLAHPHHHYWRDDRGAVEAIRRVQLESHHQVTDAYLLGLALRHKGRFVTMDRRIAKLMPRGADPDALEIIRA
ncbi:MAG TPA: TA system VapC family ribonuclease toxin [Bryobacteraceae bacterium]